MGSVRAADLPQLRKNKETESACGEPRGCAWPPPPAGPLEAPAQPSQLMFCPGAEGWAEGPELLGFPNR